MGSGRGGAMELTVSLASGVQPGVGRCPLGADATCWNRRRKRPGWLAPSQAPSTPHFAPLVQGSVLASWLSQRGLQWAREPGTCRVFLFCSLRNDSSSNRAALLFRSSALTCKYLNFFAFRYRETCLVFLFFFFPPSFPWPSTMLSFTVVSPGFVFYFICLSVSSLWPSLSSTPVPCEIPTYHSRDLPGMGGSGVQSPVAVPTQPLPFHGAQGDQKGAGCSQSRVSPELGLQAPRGPDSFSSPRGPCNMRFVCRPCCGCWHGALELDSGEGHGKEKKKNSL